jgi:glycerol kinase
MLMNVGESPVFSKNGLLTTAGYSLGDGRCTYALEGSVAIAGAAIQWLRDNLKIVDESGDSEYMANKVDDSGGVYFVPAFSGLYAPYWDMSARGAIVGLTRFIRKEHIIRATLESICYQTRDIVEAMNRDSGVPLAELKVDGGAVKNSLLMQLQSDILGTKVTRPVINETTALGAAFAAGLAVGFWRNIGELRSKCGTEVTFSPGVSDIQRDEGYDGWKRAIEKSRGWITAKKE